MDADADQDLGWHPNADADPGLIPDSESAGKNKHRILNLQFY